MAIIPPNKAKFSFIPTRIPPKSYNKVQSYSNSSYEVGYMVDQVLLDEAKKLRAIFANFRENDIIFDRHYEERFLIRPMPKKDEIIENILNPVRLKAAEKQSVNKWRCYFVYKNALAHIYVVMVAGRKLKIKTAWILNRDWRRELNARTRV